MVVRANHRADGIGGHLATSPRPPPSTRSGSTTSSAARTPASATSVLPGPRRTGIYARPSSRAGCPRPSSTTSAGARRCPGRVGGLSSYPHRVSCPTLGIPDGLDGARAHQRHLPGALQPLPLQPPPGDTRALGSGHSSATGSVTSPRRSAPSRWPPASSSTTSPSWSTATCSASTAGSRQRQDHPGARGHVPWRGVECHQGGLGLALGRAAGP